MGHSVKTSGNDSSKAGNILSNRFLKSMKWKYFQFSFTGMEMHQVSYRETRQSPLGSSIYVSYKGNSTHF